jgi:long-chain fatty acid transport protein
VYCNQISIPMRLLLGTSLAVLAGASSAMAGGFALREQSAFYQGMSFAGNAAGDHLSSMFWNSAATASFDGTNTSSTATLFLPTAKVHVDNVNSPPIDIGAPIPVVIGGFDTASPNSGDIAPAAASAASYGNYQISQNLYVGMAFNGPFGLTTKPDDLFYQGSVIARTAKLMTLNGNPTVAYKVAPGVSIGGGAQIEWAEGKFKFATGSPGTGTSGFEGDDWAFGATAGVLIEPSRSTSLGLGWRSHLTHTLEGTFSTPNANVPIIPPIGPGAIPLTASSIQSEVDLELPDIVTLSLRHVLSPTTRLLGTVEWTNWSRFQKLEVKAVEAGTRGDGTAVAPGDTIEVIEANWSDGWFFSVGLEYDWSPDLTLRSGVAYEISPIDDPEKRLISIPDSDRVWLSAGLTYDYSAATTIDLGATYIFLEDSRFDRTSASGVNITGDIEAHTVILSAAINTRW